MFLFEVSHIPTSFEWKHKGYKWDYNQYFKWQIRHKIRLHHVSELWCVLALIHLPTTMTPAFGTFCPPNDEIKRPHAVGLAALIWFNRSSSIFFLSLSISRLNSYKSSLGMALLIKQLIISMSQILWNEQWKRKRAREIGDWSTQSSQHFLLPLSRIQL